MSYQFDFAKACDDATPAYEFFNSGKNKPSPQYEENCRSVLEQVAAAIPILQTYTQYATDYAETAMTVPASDVRKTEKAGNGLDANCNKFANEIDAIFTKDPNDFGKKCSALADDFKKVKVLGTFKGSVYDEFREKGMAYCRQLNELATKIIALSDKLTEAEKAEGANIKLIQGCHNLIGAIYVTEYGIFQNLQDCLFTQIDAEQMRMLKFSIALPVITVAGGLLAAYLPKFASQAMKLLKR